MDSQSIREDIARARRGERDALDRVLVALHSRMRASAKGRIRTPMRAKMATSDLLQSTYIDVVRSIGDFQGDDPATFAAWVDTMMENNLRDRVRFYQAKRRSPEVAGEDADAVDDGPSPSLHAASLEQLASVGRVLNELPEDQRRIMQLKVIEGRDYDEIAKIMNRNLGALRMLMSRARATLALRLDRILDADA